MNDAGQDWTTPRATRIAWYQVGTPEPPDADRPLPIQPVLACAGDSLHRVGSVDLSAVSLLLPVAASTPAVVQLVSGLSWFTTADPAGHTAVHLTVEPGEDDVVRPVAADILTTVQATRTGPFRADHILPDGHAVVPEPAVVGDMWLGEGRHPVTFACAVPEWTFDALGWLVALFADACRAAGIRTSVLISVRRVDAG